MKTSPLIINWHDQNAPVYSVHFEPAGKGRLATGGGDRSVRLWKPINDGENRRFEYLSTLSKHTQAVNVVRWAPKGEILASAGDDGNVILWVQSDGHSLTQFGSDGLEDKETWRTKHMCRSSGAEVYDLAWSPDSLYFIIGSMDNIARIYNVATGTIIRQVADHSHYVQGVTWDPLNEYIATQSSDRSVHIYNLKTKDGHHTLTGHDMPSRVASHAKSDLPPRRVSSSSPAPPDMSLRMQYSVDSGLSVGSPAPSAPGTPTSYGLHRNPPSVISRSRRSSFSSRRSPSPAPSMPLPAVMPMEASPKPHAPVHSSGVRNANLYLNETLTSFFRRLTFTPDGSLLLTPAGQFQTHSTGDRDAKSNHEVINTVYIYSRAGINKPPIAHLPGLKKPSIVVKCSPIIYTLRQGPVLTKNITIDTSLEEAIAALPEPISSRPLPAPVSVMDPPPPPPPTLAVGQASGDVGSGTAKSANTDSSASSPGPKPAFSLNYRMVYAVATQDSVMLYDTQQRAPLCIVSNLHCATFTDLSWSSDGLTLLISSSDGFCSAMSFTASELGQIYAGDVARSRGASSGSSQNTPAPTPTSGFAPPSPFPNGPQHHQRTSTNSFAAASPPMSTPQGRPPSPARSTSSVMTTASVSIVTPGCILSNPPLIGGTIPSIAAAGSAQPTGAPAYTPPETPQKTTTIPTTVTSLNTKREAEIETGGDGKEPKKRRIAPTPVEPRPS